METEDNAALLGSGTSALFGRSFDGGSRNGSTSGPAPGVIGLHEFSEPLADDFWARELRATTEYRPEKSQWPFCTDSRGRG
ncbi:hypothetical protein CMQ_1703 [Grosmannia clavigera kw1407]|uniref:Uncharacterized protein n=1 Tax=Grosmannia clavigera (strain kw1407 / UAMH 11150) TaxID=655863 RepID=F0XED7_GROCL|nr:uncharacterized protein CMQ_1703 [Grosmannia clavigera kw1407]EFX04775.1 hypothetical protein CMQ_1703 [Grosmannia clavigera kw1407]